MKLAVNIAGLIMVLIYSQLSVIFGEATKELFFDSTVFILWCYVTLVTHNKWMRWINLFVSAMLFWNFVGDKMFLGLLEYVIKLAVAFIFVAMAYGVFNYKENKVCQKRKSELK